MDSLNVAEKYAVFMTGGKQYQAIPGKAIAVEKIEGEAGAKLEFTTILLRKNATDDIQIGAPYVKDAVLKASIIKQERGPKLVVFRHKRRKKQRCRKGHRQPQTILRIESI